MAGLLTPLRSGIAAVARGSRRLFNTVTGYDAVIDQGKRKRASGVNRSEDQELTPYDRFRLYTTGRDISRNFSIAGWAIRKHLDYVSTFSFHPKCQDPEKSRLLVRKLDQWSTPENCDVAGRHGLLRLIRLLERARTVDGDILLLRLADGRLQAIEGDRIRTPPGGIPPATGDNFFLIHGVQHDDAGKATGYSVCKRARSSDYSTAAGMFYFERLVPAANVWHHGYFDRIDQLRGISPLAAAYNSFRDVYEGCDYALAKMKVSQLFALALYRDTDDPVGNVSTVPVTQVPVGTQVDYGQPDDSGLRIDFGRGPIQLDLEIGDKAEFLESHTPSMELQTFLDNVIGMALKGLDIPFSFYKENFTNFSGQRQAWIQYELSARSKRSDNRDLLDSILRWRLALWIQDGELPGTIDDYAWQWVSQGVPWIDPLKEVTADTQAVAAGFTSRQRVCRENGDDFFQIADEIAEENEFLEARGLPTQIQVANVQISENVPAAMGA